MANLLTDSWPKSPDMVMRHDMPHRLLVIMILPLDPGVSYVGMQQEILEASTAVG